MNKDLEYLELVDDDGNTVKAEILFTHYAEKFKKDFVVFLVEGEDNYSAAEFIEDGETSGELVPIENEEEWEYIELLLDDFFAEEDEEDDVDES